MAGRIPRVDHTLVALPPPPPQPRAPRDWVPTETTLALGMGKNRSPPPATPSALIWEPPRLPSLQLPDSPKRGVVSVTSLGGVLPPNAQRELAPSAPLPCCQVGEHLCLQPQMITKQPNHSEWQLNRKVPAASQPGPPPAQGLQGHRRERSGKPGPPATLRVSSRATSGP